VPVDDQAVAQKKRRGRPAKETAKASAEEAAPMEGSLGAASSPVVRQVANPGAAADGFATEVEAALAAMNGRAVFATTGLEISIRQKRLLWDLGAVIVADWTPHITHLVADTFRRTTKLMCAVCKGAHVVTPAYVKACREAGRLVDTAQFLLKDEVCEAAFARKRAMPNGYSLAMAVQRAQQNGPLLQGKSVYCFPSVTEKRELPLLVQASGGTWLNRFPNTVDSSIILLAERTVSSDREQQRRRTHEVYDVELLREAACTQELRLGAYRLR